MIGPQQLAQQTSVTTGAGVTVDALRREGVSAVFGLPGTTVMELIDELYDDPQIRYVSVRHEQVAAFMADGYARASGQLGVCLASRGPGAANLAIGVHNAHAEAVPVLALVGQVADAYAYREAFEEMDLTTFFAPMTKWAVEVHDPHRIPELVQRACRTAVAGRSGAVLVSLPHDVQQAKLSSPPLQPKWRVSLPAPDPAAIEHASHLLAEAHRPVIIVGGGMPSHDPSVSALAELLAAPVVTTWLRTGQISTSAPTSLGSLGYGVLPATRAVVEEADVVLALCCKMSEFTTDKWTLLPPDAALIHVDIDEAVLGRVHVPTVGIVADGRMTVQGLLDALGHGRFDPSASGIRRLETAREAYVSERVPPAARASPGQVSSRAVLDALQSTLRRPEIVLVADAPGFGTWIHRYMDFVAPDTFYGAAGGSMGWGFPAAMGIQLARPDSRVVVVVGDGSFWMVAQDLETAVRENIPIVVVVTNNFAFGNTRDRQRFSFSQRYHGVFYGNPDFAAFARLLGAHGERVTSDSDLEPAIDRALASGLPAVIDVIQDRMEGLPADLVPPGAQPRLA